VIFRSSRRLRGRHDNWIRLASFLDLPARFDYLLILPVFSDSFLQPRLSQATDLYDQRLRWNRARTRTRPVGSPQRLTRSGKSGWIIPEFAWDPARRRLLWTENRFPDHVRIDQSYVMRQLRRRFVDRLSGVRGIRRSNVTEGRVAVGRNRPNGRKSDSGLHNLRYRASSSAGRRPDTSRSPSSGALPGT
jgi:hypothetical protein